MTTNDTTTTTTITHYDRDQGETIIRSGLPIQFHPTTEWDDTCLALSDRNGLRCSLTKDHVEAAYFHRAVSGDGVILDCWEGQVQEQVEEQVPEPVVIDPSPLAQDRIQELERQLEHITALHANQTKFNAADQARVLELEAINANQVANIAGYQQQVVDMAARIQELSANPSDRVMDLETQLNEARGERDIARVRESDLVTKNQELMNQLMAQSSQWDADVERISARLIQESEARDWCSEYDSVIADLNRNLHRPLEVRRRTYLVTTEYTVRVEREVDATDEDDAIDQASGESIDIQDGYGNWTVVGEDRTQEFSADRS